MPQFAEIGKYLKKLLVSKKKMQISFTQDPKWGTTLFGMKLVGHGLKSGIAVANLLLANILILLGRIIPIKQKFSLLDLMLVQRMSL